MTWAHIAANRLRSGDTVRVIDPQEKTWMLATVDNVQDNHGSTVVLFLTTVATGHRWAATFHRYYQLRTEVGR